MVAMLLLVDEGTKSQTTSISKKWKCRGLILRKHDLDAKLYQAAYQVLHQATHQALHQAAHQARGRNLKAPPQAILRYARA